MLLALAGATDARADCVDTIAAGLPSQVGVPGIPREARWAENPLLNYSEALGRELELHSSDAGRQASDLPTSGVFTFTLPVPSRRRGDIEAVRRRVDRAAELVELARRERLPEPSGMRVANYEHPALMLTAIGQMLRPRLFREAWDSVERRGESPQPFARAWIGALLGLGIVELGCIVAEQCGGIIEQTTRLPLEGFGFVAGGIYRAFSEHFANSPRTSSPEFHERVLAEADRIGRQPDYSPEPPPRHLPHRAVVELERMWGAVRGSAVFNPSASGTRYRHLAATDDVGNHVDVLLHLAPGRTLLHVYRWQSDFRYREP